MSIERLDNPNSDYYKYLKYKKGDAFGLSQMKSDKQWLYVPAPPPEMFVLAEKIREEGEFVVVKTVNGEEQKVKKNLTHGVNPPKFDGVEDCAALSHLNEPAVFRNLKVRYDDDLIYTYSGLFLVAMNPYKRIPIYTPQMVEIYKGKRRNEIAPHIFAVADTAYRAMLADRQDQSILITGESGAGKTENTKKVIQYFASVAGHVSKDFVGTLEQQILEANPILEAFGNAKTLKNDNSSRFGKFIRLQFNAGGVIIGASIQSYLLERNRVVFQTKGERSFHIFYQLTMGANAQEMEKYKLAAPENFAFIKESGCYSIPGLNEREEFEHTKEALTVMGFTPEEQDSIFRTVSGILHLGNVPIEASNGDLAVITDKTELQIAAEMFRVDPNQLELAICKPRIKAGRDIVQMHLSQEKARYSREALAKALYGRMFLWIVKRINESIAKDRSSYFIGVLDIAGFEIFEHNSFEQLCINYTNEKLQQFFNNHMFKLEQEEYMREKINWTFIDFGMDSQDRIDLIEKKPIGILALLEEECFFPKATDETFLAKLNGAHSRNAYFKKPKFAKGTFRLAHYAGEVEYNIYGWLDKNKDPLQDDLQLTMKHSKDPFIVNLFSEEFGWQLKGPSGGPAPGGRSGKPEGSSSGGLSSVTKVAKNLGANFVTVSMAYKEQLWDLMDTLMATAPHFVRCIIPNHEKKPGHLVPSLILEQLRCNGVLEGIRISRKGFPNRVVYSDFVKRYYILCPGATRDPPDTKAVTEKIVTHLKMDPEQMRFGLTKIFFRTGQLAIIEELREKRVAEMLVIVQAGIRGWLGRRAFYKVKTRAGAAKIIQRNLRLWLDIKNSLWWPLFIKARPLIKRRDLEAEIAAKVKELAEVKAKLGAESEASKKVQAELDALKKTLDDLKAKLKAEKDASSELTGDNSKLEKKKADLLEREAELVKRVDEQAGANKALIQAKRVALDQVKLTTDNIEKERKIKKELEAIRDQNEARINELQSEIDNCNDTIERLKKAEQSLQAEIAQLTTMLEGERKNVASLNAQVREAQTAQGDLAADYDQLVSANSKESNRRRALEEDLKDVQEALDKEKVVRQAEEARGKELQAQLDALLAKHTSGTAKGNELARLKAALEAELLELQNKLDEESEKRSGLDKAKKKLENELDDLRDKLNEESIARENLEAGKRKRESELQDLTRQLDAANLKISQLEKLKAALEQQIADLKAALQREIDARLTAEKNRKKLEADVEELQKQIDAEAKERSNLEKHKKKLESDVKDAKQLADDEKKAREELDRGNRSLEGDLQILQEYIASGGDAANTLEREKKILEVKLDDLRAQLDSATESRNRAEKQKKDAEAQLVDVRDRLHESEDRLEVLTLTKRKLDVELADLRKQLEEALDARLKNEQASKNANAQIVEVRNQLENEAAAKQRMERDRKKAEEALEEWENKLRTETAERIKLAKQIEKLDADIKVLKRGRGQEERNPELVAKLEAELADLRDQLDAEQNLRALLEKSKRTLEAELKDLNEQLEDALAAKARLDKIRRELEETADDLKTQLEKSGASDLLETLRVKHLSDMEELRKKFDYESDTRARYDSQRKALSAEIQELRDQIEEEQRQKAAIDRSRKKAETDMAGIKEALETAVNEKNKALREMRRAEKALKEEKIRIAVGPKGGMDSEEVRKLAGQLNDLKDQLARANTNKQNEERRGRTLQDEIATIKQEIDLESQKRSGGDRGLDQQLRDLQKELADLEASKEAAEEEKKSVDEQVERLKKEIDAAQTAKKRAEERYRTLQTEHDKTKKLLDDEKRGKVDAERAKRRLESDLEDVRSRLAKETADKEKAEKAKKKAEKEVKEAQKRLNEREQQKIDAEKKVFKLTQELEQAKARYDQTQKEIDALNSMIKNQLEAQIEAINDQIDAEKKARLRIEKLRRDLDKEVEELRTQIEEEENSKLGKDNVLAQLHSQREELRKQLEFEAANRDRAEDAKKELEREIIALKMKLETASKERSANEGKKAEREDELVIVRSNLEEETKLRERAEKALEKAEKELAESAAQLMDAGTKTGDEGKEVARLDAEVKKLREKIEEEIKKKKDNESEKRKLEDQIANLKDKLRRAEDALQKAKDDAALERKQKAKLEDRLNAILGAAAGKVDA